MGEIAILRAANQADDPQVELALRGIELDAAEARFRATDPYDERAFTIVDDELYACRKRWREQVAKVTGQDADQIERRLLL